MASDNLDVFKSSSVTSSADLRGNLLVRDRDSRTLDVSSYSMHEQPTIDVTVKRGDECDRKNCFNQPINPSFHQSDHP